MQQIDANCSTSEKQNLKSNQPQKFPQPQSPETPPNQTKKNKDRAKKNRVTNNYKENIELRII